MRTLAVLLLTAASVRGAPVMTWEPVRHAGSAAAIEGVAFTGTATGWLLQRDGIVQHTVDGGRTWAMRSRVPGPARSLAVRDGLVVLAGDGIVWSSTSGGRAWRESRVGGGGSFNATAIAPDGSPWIVGMAGEVHGSRDGGATWVSVGRPSLGHLFAVGAGPDGRVLAGGLRGLWESRDGGARWSYVNLARVPEVHVSPRPVITQILPAVDGVWIAGRLDDCAMLWRAEWSAPTEALLVHHEDDYRYLRVARGPRDLLWVGGPAGFLARSADRGHVWSQEPPGIAGEIRALIVAPEGVLAGGTDGRLFRGRDPGLVP